ncbi:MAG: hypothetical protein ACXWM7_04865 [Parachlamydiaceae bacterium]
MRRHSENHSEAAAAAVEKGLSKIRVKRKFLKKSICYKQNQLICCTIYLDLQKENIQNLA